ncbi:phosphatase PAP2 family protein [Flavobacterium alkalisoli]|uniref:Phosphatase PAP2 family protein n=1 Tax=Flavobacterium alkalisoli TaxID=2602769 RepID=A0A5B9FTV2_9FLAO|nr:phosphatase PAP2 family protein [Flavobacterium alkalisoli]QEE50385.1 phosphatase PAP2 family protein [Flavobacterium alkalisoli]
MIKKLILFLALFPFVLTAQDATTATDTIVKNDFSASKYHFKLKQVIIPSTLIAYGVIGLNNDDIKRLNADVRDEVLRNEHKERTIDDVTRFVPMLSVYALNLVGVEGEHNFKDRTIILTTSLLITFTTVRSLKAMTDVQRPDITAYNSFPSGHTATAFAGAEFLLQEYKDKSIWYGISGYVVATGTGLMRIYNNRHWLTDVAAGAGIGILSTKIAYWVYPFLKNRIFKDKKGEKQITAMVMPFYNGEQFGGGMVVRF